MIVIGAGRVGGSLRDLDPAGVELLDRQRERSALAAPAGRPILVATRNDALSEVIATIPRHRFADLVFVQNGMLRPWVAQQGLGEVTRGILFFAVQARGDAPIPGGASPFCGPQASTVVQWMQAHGLPAKVVGPADFARVELEKLVWNCVFGVMGQALELSVGALLDAEPRAYRDLSYELIEIGARALQVDMDAQSCCTSMERYARSIPNYRASVKEWAWRNGWFVTLQRQAQCFLNSEHARWLERAGQLPAS